MIVGFAKALPPLSLWLLMACATALPIAPRAEPEPMPRAPSHAAWTQTLQKVVHQSGLVDYAMLQDQPHALRDYLGTLSAVSEETFQSWSENDQVAFLINVYNAATVELILDRWPIASIRDIGGPLQSPWKKRRVRVFGQRVSLDHVEHTLLRPNYDLPEIHFALVCAAKGCPPLRNEAYTGERLSAQLQDQARRFFAQPSKNRLDESADTLYLSPIFKWFADDFESAGRSRIEMALKYLAPERPELAARNWRIRFTKYDWSLNEWTGQPVSPYARPID